MSKPVILSGIQPTGGLNIGTFIGAIRNWVKLQNDHECLYMVVDLHALTIRQNPQELRERCLSFVAQYIACGIDPDKNTIFMQSHVRQHSELAWILNCIASMGELSRMTQFKEKSQKFEQNINVGLFAYPVLMAADILLYQTDLVPVGNDQKQHLELTRDIAQRFNTNYQKEVFRIPQPYIPQVGARIMSLQDPLKKMSKSDENEKASLWLLDSPKQMEKKIKSAVTDSGSCVEFDADNKPGIANLLTILSVVSNTPVADLVDRYKGLQYGHLKVDTAKALVDFLTPVQQKYHDLMKSPDFLMDILREGSKKASKKAETTMETVREVVGLVGLKMEIH